LPTRYNDDALVEPEKFLLIAEEIVAQFGAVTMHPEPLRGTWVSEGSRYEDENVKLVVDVEDTGENAAFFIRQKQILKKRFRQLDIWIVSYEIRLT
jgi:hypothetical protein